ncbi:MAG: hypothetical protein R2865_01040 [Deinococcales bacterium]
MNAPVAATLDPNPQVKKSDLLHTTVEHIDITSFDARPIINSMSKNVFTSRDLARATEIFNMMLEDKSCSVFLTLAGSPALVVV